MTSTRHDVSRRTAPVLLAVMTGLVLGASSTADAGRPGRWVGTEGSSRVALSKDGRRLYTHKPDANPRRVTTYSLTSRGAYVAYGPVNGGQRAVGYRDAIRLRLAARRQLAQERRGQALIERGRATGDGALVDRGAALVRSSRAPLQSRARTLRGPLRRDRGFKLNALGEPAALNQRLTGMVTFTREPGTTRLVPVEARIVVEGAAAEEVSWDAR